jgi:hypothetical protein
LPPSNAGDDEMKPTIDMAREAGIRSPDNYKLTVNHMSIDQLKAFEALVRADEREACARVCDDYDVKYDVCSSDTAEGIALQIRARGNT